MPTFELSPPDHMKAESAAHFNDIVVEMVGAGVTPEPWHAIKIELLVATIEHICNRRDEVRAAGVLSIALPSIDEEWMASAIETAKALRISRPGLGRLIDRVRTPSPDSFGLSRS